MVTIDEIEMLTAGYTEKLVACQKNRTNFEKKGLSGLIVCQRGARWMFGQIIWITSFARMNLSAMSRPFLLHLLVQ